MIAKYGKYVRFVLLVVVIILLNVASTSLFVRADLTRGKVFTLSQASKDAVANLEEPLTIKVFLSKNLPAPYNNIEQQLRDLLEEYVLSSNEFFNYTIYSTGAEEGGSEEDLEFEEMARGYRIYPMQIQKVERDEVKLQSAYMGIALIHGDTMETLSVAADKDRLEYRITQLVNKMSKKMSALLSLKENIQVKLFLSSNLYALGGTVEGLPEEVRQIVQARDSEYYGRLTFIHLDPYLSRESSAEAERLQLTTLRVRGGSGPAEGELAYAGVVVALGKRAHVLNLFSRGIFGYQIVDTVTIETAIENSVESLLDVSEKLGYVSDHGTPELAPSSARVVEDSTRDVSLGNFDRLVSENYSFTEIALGEEDVPEGIGCLLVVAPREGFSDHELYQIDQFLMNGNSLMLFLDPFDVILPDQQQLQSYGGAQPQYVARSTGLEALLTHYGVTLESAYVLDEQSFVQRQMLADRSVSETPIYFAPKIGSESMNRELSILDNISELIMLTIAPLVLNPEQQPGVVARQLFSSSDRAWRIAQDAINYTNPLYAQPPAEEERQRQPLAYLLEGEFTSFFAGKEIPSREELAGQAAGESEQRAISADNLEVQQEFHEQGVGRLFVIGSSVILGDNFIDQDGASGNAVFILNLIDYMNDREEFVRMRSKGLTYRPLDETEPAARTFIKTFNIAGLPIIVIVAGILVWFGRISQRNSIRRMFGQMPNKVRTNTVRVGEARARGQESRERQPK